MTRMQLEAILRSVQDYADWVHTSDGDSLEFYGCMALVAIIDARIELLDREERGL